MTSGGRCWGPTFKKIHFRFSEVAYVNSWVLDLSVNLLCLIAFLAFISIFRRTLKEIMRRHGCFGPLGFAFCDKLIFRWSSKFKYLFPVLPFRPCVSDMGFSFLNVDASTISTRDVNKKSQTELKTVSWWDGSSSGSKLFAKASVFIW